MDGCYLWRAKQEGAIIFTDKDFHLNILIMID